jgi:lysophospholipase L1-like esterase
MLDQPDQLDYNAASQLFNVSKNGGILHMTPDKTILRATAIGRAQAADVLTFRKKALRRRAAATRALPKRLRIEGVPALNQIKLRALGEAVTAGVLIAEGDSWFDYPFHDILRLLEDDYAYDVESVAHKGDPVEEMAYGSGQLEELTRRLEKLLRRGSIPTACLLSGGGNDVAGDEFAMLLNHAQSAVAGLNDQVVVGVIDQRIRMAYVTILSAVTAVCIGVVGRPVPILIHGYDYPVPDGRGFLGGWGFLPGPWLEPGFRLKGFDKLQDRIRLVKQLIDKFNAMVAAVAALSQFAHVTYIDLRGTLSTGDNYRAFWANELHPTEKGFQLVTERFAKTLLKLPSP